MCGEEIRKALLQPVFNSMEAIMDTLCEGWAYRHARTFKLHDLLPHLIYS